MSSRIFKDKTLPIPITNSHNDYSFVSKKFILFGLVTFGLILIQLHFNKDIKETFQVYIIANDSNHIIFDNMIEPPPASRQLKPIKFQESLPDDCLDEWISNGVWGSKCSSVDTSIYNKVDPVFPWVNGSDPAQIASVQSFIKDKVDIQHRYQEHDELRYALRSIDNSVGDYVGKYHVLAGSLPINDNVHIGQHPIWLSDQDDKVKVHHHYNFFQRMPENDNEVDVLDKTGNWRKSSLPNFNSFAIEAQMYNIDDVESDTIVYHNDDFFTLNKNSISDYYSPIHGPVLKSLSYSMYIPQENPLGSRNGEGVAISRSSWILGKRFGMRERPYIEHHARSLSFPLLHESAVMFPGAYNNATVARFRHEKDAPWAIQSFFFASWFIAERHREALLWSWIVAKWGSIDEIMDDDKKFSMWNEVTGNNSNSRKFDVYIPYRETVKEENLKEDLNKAGIPLPINTEYSFSSMDGYGPGYLRQIWHRLLTRYGWPDLTKKDNKLKACTIVKEKCFGNSSGSTPSELFKHIAFKEFDQCGDCIITSLIAQSGSKGLSKILPNYSINLPSYKSLPHLPLSSDWRNQSFSLSSIIPNEEFKNINLRAFTNRLIMRYNHIFAKTPSQFTKIKSPNQLIKALSKADNNPSTTFICLNDDIEKTSYISKVNDIMMQWFNSRWPNPAKWER